MSRYLVRRIEDNPSIDIRTQCEISGVEGDHHLERVRCRNGETGTESVEDIRHLFVMTGAVPATKWLEGCLALDVRGGNIKRVASAVGEGSIAVAFVHQVLRE